MHTPDFKRLQHTDFKWLHHPDLRRLLWGAHLSRLLAACGVQASEAEPSPRIAPPVPVWFQRICAALTLLGLVATLRVVDRAVSRHPQDDSQQAELSSWDAASWRDWTRGLQLRLNPFALTSLAGYRGSPALNFSLPVAWLGRDPGSTATASTASASSAIPRDASAAESTKTAGPAEQTGSAPSHRFQRILVTAYSSSTGETDENPAVTATNTPVAPGTIAMSRDLLRTFTPGAPFDFGEKVLIPGVGIFEVHDTMHPRWHEKADIWFASPEQARAWGRRTVFVTGVEDDAPTIAFTIH